MSAFNHIEFVGRCPKCGDNNVLITAQFYVGASFERNDKGLFCANFYKLGDKINWYEKDDPRYPSWTIPDELPQIDGRQDEVIEICAAECRGCGFDKLNAVILFKELRAVRVLDLDFEENITSSYCYIDQYIKEKVDN
jgi:predicted Zn-ribbon and HTH transcriptional regulator